MDKNQDGAEGARILIVDDEKDFCDILFLVVKRAGFTPVVANDGHVALEMIERGIPEVMLLDVRMPGMDGLEVLNKATKINPELPIIMITAYSDVENAVETMRRGAYDYVSKPLDNNALIKKIKSAISERRILYGQGLQKDTDISTARLKKLMGPSAAVERLVSDINLVAGSNFSVVIQGETGSGKELVAQAIHRLSKRSSKLMVPVDCGAIPETLFESEVFGHERGSFTGAVSSRMGKFELAKGGTLFLDEISNMPLSCQAKLLRAIQEKSFFRVGGQRALKMDVRLIIASNRELNNEVAFDRFSRDLFYRLSEFTIIIPPLRDRKEDIIYLANLFLNETNVELNKNIPGFSDSAIDLIKNYPWPGNVRQLKASVRRAVLQSQGWISSENLVLDMVNETQPVDVAVGESEPSWDGHSLKEIVQKTTADVESRILTKVLRKTGGNKAKAARLLQIDYKTIHSKIKQYGIKLYPEEE